MNNSRLKSSVKINIHHKDNLKRALLQNYSNISLGNAKTKQKRSLISWNKVALVGAATMLILVVGININTSKNTPLTAQKVFALAHETYQAKSTNRGRYQHAIVRINTTGKESNSVLGQSFRDMSIERFYDTSTKSERVITRDVAGKIIGEELTLEDGTMYTNQSSVFGDYNPNPDASLAKIGLSFETIQDMTPKEVDDKLVKIGEKAIFLFWKDLPVYTITPNNLSKLPQSEQLIAMGNDGSVATSNIDNTEAYNQCIAGQKDSVAYGKLDVFMSDSSNPEQYAAAFDELSRSDKFTLVHSGSWNKVDSYGLRYTSSVKGGDTFTAYFNKSDYSLVGIESKLVGFEYTTVVEKNDYSNDPINLSTEGLSKLDTSGLNNPKVLAEASKQPTPEDLCDSIKSSTLTQ
jgi:hypothetical protein